MGKRLIENGVRVPDAIVGDGDSLPEAFKEKYKDIYHQVEEQEYNDLTKATLYAIRTIKGKSNKEPSELNIAYVGATGRREDHTLGNIFLLNYYATRFGIKPVMLTDYGYFSAHNGNSKLETFARQQVSIFNIDCKEMTSEGLKWQAYPCGELWQGTLNEAIADMVSIVADGKYIVFRTYDPK